MRRWVVEDHLYNCETMLLRLQTQGYTGRVSLLKQFVHPFCVRPRLAGARTHEALWEAMLVALDAITPEDAIAWFTHVGYALPAPAT